MNLNDFELRVKQEVKRLINKDDEVLVALSGGKDSSTILYLLNKWGYNVSALMIDPNFKHFKKHRFNAINFCKKLGVNLKIIDVKDMRAIQLGSGLSNCAACGVIKRWLINKEAKNNGYDLVVTGHNLDDRAEAVLMNLVMNNPRLNLNLFSDNNHDLFVRKVKPLNNIPEGEIRFYSEAMGFKINYDICPHSSNAFRREVKNLMNKYDADLSNIISFAKKLLPRIKNEFNDQVALKNCVSCGEPSRSDLCRYCEITSSL